MELLVFRHGLAGEREEWAKSGRPDSERPLTPEGRKKTSEAAEGVAALVECELIASSPYIRAVQTAELLADELDGRVELCPHLVPDAPFEKLAAWLGERKEERVAVVGHEPQLSRFTSWLLGVEGRSVVAYKKAGAALLEMKRPGAGRATLLWSIPPKALRRLA